ncbi:MAG: CHASE2 domain-containing serine/threonine-protein kinase [Elusimicrobiota bacterium]
MRNKKGLLIDAGAGLVLTLVVMTSYMKQWPLMASVEFRAYDLRAKLRETLKSPDEIALVAIDEESISQIGRWPWSRGKIAAGLDKIAAAHPKVIGLNVLFSEPEQSMGLAEVRRLETRYKELLAGKKITQKKGAEFDLEFASSTVALDSDSRLLASLQAAGNVVMPVFFAPNDAHGDMVAPPAEVSSAAVRSKTAPDPGLTQEKMIWPLPAFSGAAAGLGHSNFFPESDGTFRRDFPMMSYAGSYYPSYALRLAMAYVGAKPEDVRFTPGVEVSAGRLRVPLDEDSAMAVTFVGPPNAAAAIIKRVSFASVLNGSTGADFFKDKIVLIGPTALGVGTSYVTPVAGDFPSIEIVAHVIENILQKRFLTRPPWAVSFELGVMAALGLFIMLVLPRLRAFWGLVISVLLAVIILGAGTYFFVAGQWIKVGYPLILLVGGYLIVISKSFLITEKGKELVEASAIETNKMLGLSFQGQGMLDLAFEKFRLCPLDDNMKDTLYNLALDFERKRQYSKAAAVFDHIAAKDSKYKDVVERGKKLKEASEGAVFGGVGAKKEGTVMLAGGASKPTLGRYEIEKELGRGAMGVVYLGRDPKINRMVAIKTMMLEEGSDGGSLKEVKERFFREAESAGTLNHPNIVRIFDAGEENEVAYIAMELLDGVDLTKYVAKDALLPVDKALDYVATVADALDYAHKQGIVHRDIKPANIMLLKDGSIRVADFGIARITASSKTATGTVMGTPSYMSPEQVAGRKVDGRSDLFSLTVALYELVTGEKPFKGGEGIGTLLFQIANDPTPDILEVNPKLPPALKAVIEQGLAKNPDERFARGSDLAAAIRGVLSGAAAPAAAPVPAQRTAEITAPVPEASAPKKPADASATVKMTGLDFPELDTLRAMPPAPVPKPAAPAVERTAAVGPDITIPGLNDLPKPATPPPAPRTAARGPDISIPSSSDPMIELPQHSGVGPASAVPPPPKPSGDADATMRIEPTQSPDATLRLKPNPQEPS